VTDHRIGLSLHDIDGVLQGDLDAIIDALREKVVSLKLQGENA
jgi:protein subunit release factor A